MTTYVLLFCAIFMPFFINAQDIGDDCQVARSGARGECKIINDCMEVVDQIVKEGLFPTPCGFRGRDQIVCCPKKIQLTTTTTPAPARISQKKCRDYVDAKYERIWNPGPTPGSPDVQQKIERCAKSGISFIVGGENANAHEFPHMVLIGLERNFQPIVWGCGGTLISEDFVLTAAHCVVTTRYEGTPKYVLLGEHDLTNDKNDRPFQVEIAERFPHPEFRRSAKYFDIALIRMAIRITFSPYIRPACLPEKFESTNTILMATGWGRTDFRGSTSQVLQKVNLELFTEDECNITYADAARTTQLRNGILPAQQFCAGSHTDKKDTCQGDSGGPLQVSHPYLSCIDTIVGITSFAKQCGDLNAPGVYTRVYNFLDWIEGIVWPNQ